MPLPTRVRTGTGPQSTIGVSCGSRAHLHGHLADAIEVADIDRDWNVRRVTVVEKVIETNAGGGANHLIETRNLQELDLPDFQHQRLELRGEETHSASGIPRQVYGIEMPRHEGLAHGPPPREGARG